MDSIEFTKDEKVNYIGKGFIGYDPNNTEMVILYKITGTRMTYKVKYLDFKFDVWAHEIEKNS